MMGAATLQQVCRHSSNGSDEVFQVGTTSNPNGFHLPFCIRLELGPGQYALMTL